MKGRAYENWSLHLVGGALLVGATILLVAQPTAAQDFVGTVHFQGTVSYADPTLDTLIPKEDLTVAVKSEVSAIGPGVKCKIGAITPDNPNPDGTYPEAGGDVSAQVTMTKEGVCILTVVANGTNGTSVSARGSTTVFVDPIEITSDTTFTGVDITLNRSKAVAGVTRDCLKWMRKQHKKRAQCNLLILKKGGAVAVEKCKDACSPKDPYPCEPVDCDPSNYVEAALALSFGGNDQQTDMINGLAIDTDLLADQFKCQKHLGLAAANYLKKRNQLVEVNCIEENLDSESCRATQTQEAKNTLDRITKCVGDQMVDLDSSLVVPDVETPCDACIDWPTIDLKCMRSCFESVLGEYSDLIIGDVPECGNGITQSPEQCDDGNLTDGDCCDSSCMLEPGTTEGPNGDATCSDLKDNDCDGKVDGADPDCTP
jgi:cysteine-rich repeat protein